MASFNQVAALALVDEIYLCQGSRVAGCRTNLPTSIRSKPSQNSPERSLRLVSDFPAPTDTNGWTSSSRGGFQLSFYPR